jgi:hypothetical protein
MTRTEITPTGINPSLILEELIAKHGLITVLRALIIAARRKRARLHAAAQMTDHLRRDLGLPTQTAPPRRHR